MWEDALTALKVIPSVFFLFFSLHHAQLSDQVSDGERMTLDQLVSKTGKSYFKFTQQDAPRVKCLFFGFRVVYDGKTVVEKVGLYHFSYFWVVLFIWSQ